MLRFYSQVKTLRLLQIGSVPQLSFTKGGSKFERNIFLSNLLPPLEDIFECLFACGANVIGITPCKMRKHYENTPIQIHVYRKFHLEKFQTKNSDIFHTFAQNIDCWYSLEPPLRGGSNENPQSMF